MVKKDRYGPTHSDELPIPNLEVMCLLRSFESKGFVKGTFNWQHNYYYLTNEGIDYLREYLGLPSDVIPATLKKAAVAAKAPEAGQRGKSGPAGDFSPEFQKGKDGYRN